MFAYLQGRVEELEPGAVVLDVQDVGYHLLVSAPCAAQLEVGQKVRLLTHFAVSENAHHLFGFLQPVERNLFRRLLQVNGIGPTSALGLLSSLSPEEMVRAILDRDLKRLTAMKGVGKKTAERLVVELGDHLQDLCLGPMPSATDAKQQALASDLERVLLELGTPPAAASQGAEHALAALGVDADFQDLLRHALNLNT